MLFRSLCNLRRLGSPAEAGCIDTIARATAYRTARVSQVFSDLDDMLRTVAQSDRPALIEPGDEREVRHADWMATSPMAFLRGVARDVGSIPGVAGLPAEGLQRQLMRVLRGIEGGVDESGSCSYAFLLRFWSS